jgi:hypothetical protein
MPDITDANQIKLGTNNVSEIFFGARKLWPRVQIDAITKENITNPNVNIETLVKHNLNAGNKILIINSSQAFYNKEWIVSNVIDEYTIVIIVGGYHQEAPAVSGGGTIKIIS